MTRRDVVHDVLAGRKPPYVPWSFGFTAEATAKLRRHYGVEDLSTVTGNHIAQFGGALDRFEDIGDGRVRDVFGVVWNRSIDKDIGVVEGRVLPEPTVKDLVLPDPSEDRFHESIPGYVSAHADQFRVFGIGFSLYERAWSMRGMTEILMDFVEHPGFVHDLFTAITDFNIALVRKAVTYDIDAIYFGDDWGQQHGLIFGPAIWHEFVYPQLKRMYAAVKDAGKYVMIHSCGDVDELFDALAEIGLDCFNPFQPEVMDVYSLLPAYRGRLSFHGGLSTQKTLPYGSVDDVLKETDALLTLGRDGGYIFSPAHAVEGDVPVENMVAFIERARSQVPG